MKRLVRQRAADSTEAIEPPGDALPGALVLRVIELEIKLIYTEDQLDALNRTVYLQQSQIDSLQRSLIALREYMTLNSGGTLSLREELPPHY